MNTAREWEIRRGASADAEVLAAFATRTFSETYSSQNTAENMQVHLTRSFSPARQRAELADPQEITLLAENGSTLLAYAQLRRGLSPECVGHSDSVELHRLYVDRPAHGQGLAQALMSRARSAAAELGGRYLWLGVWERNPRAIAFYRKMGFVEVGSTQFAVGDEVQRDKVLVRELMAPD